MSKQKTLATKPTTTNKTTSTQSSPIQRTVPENNDLAVLQRQPLSTKRKTGVGVDPKSISLNSTNILALQRTVGNQAVMRLLDQNNPQTPKVRRLPATIQRDPFGLKTSSEQSKSDKTLEKEKLTETPNKKGFDKKHGNKAIVLVEDMNKKFNEEVLSLPAVKEFKYLIGQGDNKAIEVLIEIDKENPTVAKKIIETYKLNYGGGTIAATLHQWHSIESQLQTVPNLQAFNNELARVQNVKMKDYLRSKYENKFNSQNQYKQSLQQHEKLEKSEKEESNETNQSRMETVKTYTDQLGKGGLDVGIGSNAQTIKDYTDSNTALNKDLPDSVDTRIGDTLGIASDTVGIFTDLFEVGGSFIQLVGDAKAGVLKNEKGEIKKGKVIDRVINLIKSIFATGGDSTALAKDITSFLHHNFHSIIPGVAGVGLVTGILELVKEAKAGIYQLRVLRKAALTATDGLANLVSVSSDFVKAIVGKMKLRNWGLAINNFISVFVAAAKVAGSIATLSGVGSGIGAAIMIATTGFQKLQGLVKGFVEGIANARVQATRNEYKKAKHKLVMQNMNNGELIANDKAILRGQAVQLLTKDPKYFSQYLIDLAKGYLKEQNLQNQPQQNQPQQNQQVVDPEKQVREIAYNFVKMYSVTDEMLNSKDKTANQKMRKKMLGKLGYTDDPKTNGDKIRDTIHSTMYRHNTVSLLAKIKNELNYGGKKNRSTKWMTGQFLTREKTVDGFGNTIKALAPKITNQSEFYYKLDLSERVVWQWLELKVPLKVQKN